MPFFKGDKSFFLVGFLCFCTVVFSQNLVSNPSFEEFNNCPSALGNFKNDVSFWSMPTLGSTDYFNICSESMGTPKNFKGSQISKFGNGYAGLFLYAPADYREYIQAELHKPLKKGVLYSLSFYVSLADKSDTAIKEFGILFTQNSFQAPIKKELSKMHLSKLDLGVKTYLEIGYSNFFKDTRDWIVVHTQFVANGKEQYLTIGNFKSNKRTRRFGVRKENGQGAYYYIDMIKVKETHNKANVEASLEDYSLNKTHVFKNVHFTFDSYQMDASSEKELLQLSAYLKEHPKLHITISGHTDTVGGEDYNMRLSLERAKNVAEFLHSSGILKERITWEGYGFSKPLESKSEEDKNRRVEFLISGTSTVN